MNIRNFGTLKPLGRFFSRRPHSMTVASTFDGKVDLFGQGDQAKMYQAFRPVYPKEVIEDVMSHVSARKSYVDVACGSGQMTRLISPLFEKTIGIDQSLEQLKNAPEDPSIEYKAGSVFALPLADNSVDLVTVAQGFHWFQPYEKAFAEINRVLKPNGVFVAVGYAFPQIVTPASAMTDIVNKFYIDILGSHKYPGQPGCWWDISRPTVDSYLGDIPFPEPVVRKVIPARFTRSTSDYCNYLRTLSAYRTLIRAGEPDPMVAVERELEFIAGGKPLEIEIPFFTVATRKSSRA